MCEIEKMIWGDMIMNAYRDIKHDIDSCEDVWNGFYKKIYPGFFSKYLDFSKLEDKETSIKCKRWYIKLLDDLSEKKKYPNFKMAGDCIFNFNSKKAKILKGYIGEDKEGLDLLRYCVEHHHTYLNFSFMPITGGMNNTKGRHTLDRPEILTYELLKHYEGEESKAINGASSANIPALIYYLSWFEIKEDISGRVDAKKSISKYMKEVYQIEDDDFVSRFLGFANVDVCDKDTAIDYMRMAKEFWEKRNLKNII